MEDRGLDRSELEEMIASSPFGTTFLAPTIAGGDCEWSFLVHESDEVTESILEIDQESESAEGSFEARGVLITLNLDGGEVLVFVFLFRFADEPQTAYAAFMNPLEPDAIELLKDVGKQEKLTVEFFDEAQAATVVCANELGTCIEETIELLSEVRPSTDEAYDSAINLLLSQHPDPATIWDLLDPDIVAIEIDL